MSELTPALVTIRWFIFGGFALYSLAALAHIAIKKHGQHAWGTGRKLTRSDRFFMRLDTCLIWFGFAGAVTTFLGAILFAFVRVFFS